MNAIERIEKNQRRVFHALAYRLGMSEDERRQMLLDNFGVESSADLDAHQLTDLIHTLERIANPELKKLDTWRKRLIAAVSGYLKDMGRECDIYTAKRVACRAAGKDSFDNIPLDRLRSLYNAFTHRSRDLTSVSSLMQFPVNLDVCKNQLPS